MEIKDNLDEPVLYLVPTPIGNLDDITIRALNILQKVKVIFAEDTRETQKLLNYYTIKKKLIATHDHNEIKIKHKMTSYLEKGLAIALVSDRGTPLISDPGYECVTWVLQKGYKVVALPGPNAFVPALITSGLPPYPFLFFGFLSNNKAKRRKQLCELMLVKHTLIFYEAPFRLEETLTEIYKIMGNRLVSVAREISKQYETIYRGQITNVIKEIDVFKGEFVIVVNGVEEQKPEVTPSLIKQVDNYREQGLSIKDAIKQVAIKAGVKKKDLYKKYHE